MPFFKNKESGLSLISILIAAGILGILAVGASRMMVNSFRSSKNIEQRDERSAIRQAVLRRFSCTRTLGVASPTPPIACPANITPRDTRGNNLFGANGRVGNSIWVVTASCQNGGIGFTVEGQLPDGTRAQDALTRRDLNPRALFPTGEIYCREFFSAAAATACGPGQTVDDVTSDGLPVCEDFPTRNQTCNGRAFVRSFGNAAQANCAIPLASATCPAGEVMVGFDANGNLDCREIRLQTGNVVEVTGNQAGVATTSTADICMLQNVEYSEQGNSSGFDCQLYGGTNNWQLFGSNRALPNGQPICGMICFNVILQ